MAVKLSQVLNLNLYPEIRTVTTLIEVHLACNLKVAAVDNP